MMLCHYEGYWYIVTCTNATNRFVSLSVGPKMVRHERFSPEPPNNFVQCERAELRRGFTFYPELYYRGFRVRPVHWANDSQRPVLKCSMDLTQFSAIGVAEQQFSAFVRAYVIEGWARPDRSILEGMVYVDDLEKIEGPMPEGTL